MLVIDDKEYKKLQALVESIDDQIAQTVQTLTNLNRQRATMKTLCDKFATIKIVKMTNERVEKRQYYVGAIDLEKIVSIVKMHVENVFEIKNLFQKTKEGTLLRERPYPEARYIAVKLIIEDFNVSVQQEVLAKVFGFSEHSSISYCIARFYELSRYDKQYMSNYEYILGLCEREINEILKNINQN